MDSFFKSLRRKLSVDNLFMKGADEPLNKDEDVRKTLEKTEPNDIIHVDEIAEKLKEIAEPLKNIVEEKKSNHSNQMVEKSKSSFGVLQKTGEEDENFNKNDNVMGFLD